MYVTIPITLTDAMITATTAPDSGTGEYPGIVIWTATSFGSGDYVLHTPTNSVYRASSAATSGDVPGVAVLWVFQAKNNPYRLIDGTQSSATSAPGGFNMSIEHGTVAGALAGFNISGVASIVVSVNSDGEGYSRTIYMNDNSEVINEWWYFFAPITYRSSFVIYDLPPSIAPTIDIEFVTTATASVGEIVIGNRRTLGAAIDGSGFDNDDLSYVAYDEFGNVTDTVIRPNIDAISYDVKLDSNKVRYLRNTLKSIGKTTKCVWAGSIEPFDDLLSYGFYENFSVIIYSNTSDCSIKVRTVA